MWVSDPVVRFLSSGRWLFAGCCALSSTWHVPGSLEFPPAWHSPHSGTLRPIPERCTAPARLTAAPARGPLPKLGAAPGAARPQRCPQHHSLSEKVPGILKVASVSLPGTCAKGKSKSLFSTQTQDPLLELSLERQRVEDRPSLPPQDPSGQCSLNLREKGETAAGDTDSCGQRADAQLLPCAPAPPPPHSLQDTGDRGDQAELPAATCVRKPGSREQRRQFPSLSLSKIGRRDYQDHTHQRYLLGKKGV